MALDLDGTLLTSDKRVTERARHAIARLTAEGIRVVIATGRPPRSAMPFARALAAGTPTVVFNGAAVVAAPDGAATEGAATDGVAAAASVSVRVLNTLDRQVVLAAVERLRARVPDAELALESASGWFVERWEPSDVGSGLRLDAAEPTGVGRIERFIDDGAIKLLARHQELDAETMAAAVEDLAVSATWSAPRLLEVLHPAVDKRAALATLCDEYGIAASQVAAFGDQHNDRGMLAWAGLGVAMANADARAIAAADIVTASNDEDGVAIVLEAWFDDVGHGDHPSRRPRELGGPPRREDGTGQAVAGGGRGGDTAEGPLGEPEQRRA